MTITLHWWYAPIVLFIVPIAYAMLRKSSYTYDLQIDTMLLLAVCWFLGIGIMLGHC